MAKEMNKWLQFSKIGTPILDRFVCFKVPFKEEINRNLPPEKRFYLDDLFEQYPSLGMVVDLTKTTRYYDSKIITARNIKYEKIFMAGQGSLPKRNQIEKFFRLIDEFLDSQKLKNSNDFIGVHCTHGLNRTGYMVCKYMIERMNVNPDEAISAFESGRGHKIERKTYIHDLRGLPKVPVVPKRMKQSKKGKGEINGSIDQEAETSKSYKKHGTSPKESAQVRKKTVMIQGFEKLVVNDNIKTQSVTQKYNHSGDSNGSKNDGKGSQPHRHRHQRGHDNSQRNNSHHGQHSSGSRFPGWTVHSNNSGNAVISRSYSQSNLGGHGNFTRNYSNNIDEHNPHHGQHTYPRNQPNPNAFGRSRSIRGNRNGFDPPDPRHSPQASVKLPSDTFEN